MSLSTLNPNAGSTSIESGSVVLYPNRANEPEHERVVHAALAERLAGLQGLTFAGEYRVGADYPGQLYVVPSGTLIGVQEAKRLGLSGEQDLFGGLVPQPFIATKAITHPLLDATSAAPEGWSASFARQVQGSVLNGLTVFTLDDALAAGVRLLQQGPLRIKPVRATAGRGQVLVKDRGTLVRALAELEDPQLTEYGLVLEEHLEQVVTYSVGQVRVAELLVSYYGTQNLVEDNHGEVVYGGSDLVVVNGDFDALLGLDLDHETRRAIAQAQVYDAAASECFPGFFASRRNYDIAQGLNAQGRACSGVLEQSWRIGGASSAEVAALQAFRRADAAQVIRASSLEQYGEGQSPPPGAEILYQGLDAEVGFITKSVSVQIYGNA